MTVSRSREVGRLTIAAWAGSAFVHAAAFLALATIHLQFGEVSLPERPRFIEVSLQEPPAQLVQRPAAVHPAALPQAAPLARPARDSHGEGEPRLRTLPRDAAPAEAPAHAAAGSAQQPRTQRPAGPPRSQPGSSGEPRRSAAGAGSPTAGPSESAHHGGGEVSVGAASPGGDIPTGGGGNAALGAVPGTGSGSGANPGGGEGHSGSGSGGPSEGHGSGGTGSGGTGSGSGAAGAGQGGGGGSGSGGRHVSRTADRSVPELVHRVNPAYPPSAQAEGVEGTVKLRVAVGTTGNVEQVIVAASSGDSRLDSAAVASVRQWKYRPAVQNGEPRRVETYATVSFRLN